LRKKRDLSKGAEGVVQYFPLGCSILLPVQMS
jgi:hypothetical protein